MGSLPAQVELHASLAQLAVYGADWEQVERSTEASAELAEREGLVGKLCLPIALRGLLRWREGKLEESTVLFHRAHELAEQVGWSELAFQALFGLATALRDSGDLAGAQAALDRALDVCERAGLIAQSIQATAARAVVLMLAHRREAAVEAAQEASELAERLHYPIGRAAALEAQGVCAEDPSAGAELLARGRRRVGRARPAARGRARAAAGRPGDGRRRTPSGGATLLVGRRRRRSSASACTTCPSGRGRWRRRLRYGALSAPAMTITVASPASAWLDGLTGSRCAMPRRRLTAAPRPGGRARTGRPTRRAAGRRSW